MTRPGVAPARPSGGALRRRLGPTRAAFGGLFVAMGLNMFAIGVTLPVVPRYVEGPLGEGGLAVGLVTGAFAATGIACRPLAGHLADRRGRRRAVLFGCLLASCACGLHFLPFGVGGLVFARLCLGAGQGTVYTASSAWVVDLSPPDQRGRLIGLYGLAVWGGLAVGAPIGEWTLRAGGYEAVWALALTAPLIGAAITTRLPERRPSAASGPVGRRSLFATEAVVPGLGLSLTTVGYAAITAFLVLHLDSVGVAHAATVFAAYGAAIVLTRIVAGGLPDRLGPIPCVLGAALTQALGLSLLALSDGLVSALAGTLLAGTGVSLIFPSLALLVMRRVGEERRGVAMGTYTAFFDLGFLFGSPLAGLAASLGGYRAAFALGACTALGAAALALALRRRTQRDPDRTAAGAPAV